MKILKASSLLLLLAILFFSCQKEYSLENQATAAGTWQFNDSTTLYTGNMDTATISVNGVTKTMNLQGKSADGKQIFLLHLYTVDSFTVGTSYKASVSATDFQYYNQAKTIYAADQSIGEFIVDITAIGNNTVTGTFSGLSEDSTGAIKQITSGKFTTRINLSGNGTGTGGSGTASGTLGVSAGSCTPYTPSGVYTQGLALTSANTVGVTVTVTTPGTYLITTNTVNGVSFSSTGTFTTTGPQNVTLTGSGTPVSAGAQNFAVTFGASTCNFSLTFGAGAAPATGTLGGAPGTCTSATPAGTYTQGIALTTSNTVQIQVNVTTVGAYTITTSNVNGVTFTGSGNFTTTGIQNVTLTGTGTPVASGAQTFAVSFGTSSCNFPITFAAGTPPPTGDYFPTTLGLNWAYGLQGGQPSDSFQIKSINNNYSTGGNTYSIFTVNSVPSNGTQDSLYYRKAAATGGNDYFEYFNTQAYFGFDGPGTPANLEYTFLKDYVAQGTIWQSGNITGSQGGTTFTIFIKMTLIAKAVTATSGVVTSPDVDKVKYEYFLASAPTTPFYTEERWFARGIGLIYNSFYDGTKTDVYFIGRY